MTSKALTLLALTVSALAAPLAEQAACSGPRVLWARGSYEDYNNSTLLPLVNNVVSATGGSSSSIIYPSTIVATDTDPIYQQSVAEGINNTKLQIEQWVSSCGSASRFVLLGYSQGGQVMTDTLAGGLFEPAGIDSSYWKYITVSTVFGDPTFTYPSKYAAGNATTSGINQRFSNDPSEAILNNDFGDSLRSYCTAMDPVCSGLEFTDIDAHLVEVHDHQAAAQAFILSFF